MLSAAMYTRLPDAPAIQRFLRAFPEVIGVGGARDVIRGYVDLPVEIAGVAVRHLLLVVEGLAFPLIIGTDILRAHRAALTLDESAPVRLRVRLCAVCTEQRTASPAEPSSSARAAPQRPILRAALSLVRVSPPCPRIAHARAPILVCPRVSATLSPIARARAAESRPLTSAPRSTQATRAPLLVCPRVSATPSPIARALAAESHPLTPASRSTQATLLLERAPLLVHVRVSVPTSPLHVRQLLNSACQYL